MATAEPQDRLQPSLLDRLTDEAPENKREPREMRVMTKQKLRDAVLRDLEWLLNATRLRDQDALAAYPDVERSVVNFGLPGFSGETAAKLHSTDIERQIREAILRFEPRILPDTLRVDAIAPDSPLEWHNVVSVQIQGHIWSQPVPLEILLRTRLDLETGQVELSEA
jgi:type VI secretion system protein ImpF